ncbi:hypothetical protein RHGRI_016444 [Rhododendron griersonianum]|uniref:WW domain-containing protein n=1 Tax=Rhododendron griersonianum TaxID=479676 RepID=A0AAV6JU81_9ERIC|nr:hypothetical protein RHGRI_016444 [Rhododendron griersonianum]
MDQITVLISVQCDSSSQLKPNWVPIVKPKKGRRAIPNNTFGKRSKLCLLSVKPSSIFDFVRSQKWITVMVQSMSKYKLNWYLGMYMFMHVHIWDKRRGFLLCICMYGIYYLILYYSNGDCSSFAVSQFSLCSRMDNNPQSYGAQFLPLGQGISSPNVGIPPNQSQPLQYSQPMQQSPIPMQYTQTSTPIMSSAPPPQPAAPQLNSHISGLGGPGVPFLSSYTFAPSSFGQAQHNVSAPSQFQPSQMHEQFVPVGGQPWMSTGSQGGPIITPVQQIGQKSSDTAVTTPAINVPSGAQQSSSDWQEYKAEDIITTRQSSWEKPLELMTPIEVCHVTFLLISVNSQRADASTVWKEFTTADGTYYNTVTKQSKWQIPEELKVHSTTDSSSPFEQSFLLLALVSCLRAC